MEGGKQMRVAILGHDGMLGHMVEKYLQPYFLDVHGFGREALNLVPCQMDQIGTKLSTVLGFEYDYVINCIGAIKPAFDAADEPTVPIYVNAIFPHQLARWGELAGCKKHVEGKRRSKIIHITTDCVWDGLGAGAYDESDAHNARDLYGKSKSLGEPTNCMVLRTSIIGPEKKTKKSLLEWVRTQDGKEINGFTNHLWNGVTTLQLAKSIRKIIEEDWYEDGAFHIHSDPGVTKFELVSMIVNALDLNITVNRFEASVEVDRTMSTNKGLNAKLQIPPLKEQIEELAYV